VADKDKGKAKKEAEELAREMAKREAEEAKQAKKEAERLAKEEARARKEAEKLAKEQTKKEAEEAKIAKKEAERLAKEEARASKEAEKRAKKEAEKAEKATAPDVSAAAAEGKYQLVLPSSASFKQVKLFTERLASIDDIQVVWTGGSTDEGTLITVSVAKALPLAQIIGGIPMVGGVEVKGDKIMVTMEFSA
jgi:hypothetical protein